jgi:hypothetical protein
VVRDRPEAPGAGAIGMLGYSKVPLRLGVPPEILRIELS